LLLDIPQRVPGDIVIGKFLVLYFQGIIRRRQGLYGFEFRAVRIVAVHAQAVLFFAVPFTGPFAVDPGFPVPENRTMALATEIV
jgi:hypothetical protein